MVAVAVYVVIQFDYRGCDPVAASAVSTWGQPWEVMRSYEKLWDFGHLIWQWYGSVMQCHWVPNWFCSFSSSRQCTKITPWMLTSLGKPFAVLSLATWAHWEEEKSVNQMLQTLGLDDMKGAMPACAPTSEFHVPSILAYTCFAASWIWQNGGSFKRGMLQQLLSLHSQHQNAQYTRFT